MATFLIADPLKNNKILTLSYLKTFADDIFIMTYMVKFPLQFGTKHCTKKEKMLVTTIFSILEGFLLRVT